MDKHDHIGIIFNFANIWKYWLMSPLVEKKKIYLQLKDIMQKNQSRTYNDDGRIGTDKEWKENMQKS